MRRSVFGIGILFLGLATWIGSPALTKAQRGGRGGGGHAGGGHAAAPAHVGSVHYGARVSPARVEPAHVGPVVREGAVRSEHYANFDHGGAYRNPYRDDYFRRFRPGYRPYILDGAQYYGYDALPPGYEVVVINGITYYVLDGVYYQPYIYGGQTIFLVVPSPG